MIGMVILSFLLGYPLFVAVAYLLAKVLFPDLKKLAEEQKREKLVLLQRAQRVKRRKRTHEEQESYMFLPDSKHLISQ